MRQGSGTIHISRSNRGTAITLLLVLCLAALLLCAGINPWAMVPAQVLLSGLVWQAWRSTLGLGAAATIKAGKGGWYLQLDDEPACPLIQLRSGLVTPRVLSAQLLVADKRYNLLVFADATTDEGHWLLRRLVLRGIAPTENSAV